jgi:hypothetical protein
LCRARGCARIKKVLEVKRKHMAVEEEERKAELLASGYDADAAAEAADKVAKDAPSLLADDDAIIF